MSLVKYQKKRKFDQTPEPKGKKHIASTHIFVIQRHMATRLHYDLRLELDGVLKSWAVPKGPSMNPADKRLAVEVEDHPFDYRNFEGIIPEGNYGAGVVHIFDHGTFSFAGSEGDMNKEGLRFLKKGHLPVIFKGKIVKGHFDLVRLHGDDKNWLLIKHPDAYAVQEPYDSENHLPAKIKNYLKAHPEKIKTPAKVTAKKTERKKKLQQVKEKPETKNNISDTRAIKKFKEKGYHVMLARLADAPFDDKNYFFEYKWDGYRALCYTGDGEPALVSRTHNSFNKDFPELVAAFRRFPYEAVMDGEIIIQNAKKAADFQLMQQYFRTKKGILKYIVFDLLFLQGHDITQLPAIQRKELLEKIIADFHHPSVVYSKHFPEKGISLFEKAQQKSYEGVIAKKADSVYEENKRTGSWVKIKTTHRQETIICGYSQPSGSRKYLGSLILGIYEKGVLTYCGNCGTGFNGATLHELYEKMQPLKTGTSPFSKRIFTKGEEKTITWLKPKLVCEVKFQEWTDSGNMRIPVFTGLRKDKKPASVVREKAT